ncbi:MAG: regulator [Sphingobacteriaceae bacterium]|nr:regulator [Sphingobacteriaceae bacterium]
MSAKVFTIFVLEDDEWYNKYLVHTISLNPDYQVKSFLTANHFFETIHEKPDVVTLDYRLPNITGADALEKIKLLSPETEIIIISEQNDITTAINLLKNGAYDYLVKEKNISDRLLSIINNIYKNISLKNRINLLELELQKKHDFSQSIIGSSPAMENIMRLVEKALNVNITVTITGETGTGKEVIAKAIHYNSSRKNKPFVAINVAAIPSELIESELFGHEKGSFTGAVARRLGKFEEANGGTLFLDEIGEMSLTLQTKLLRVLQEKEITRIGSNTPIKINCRIIVATHRNLKEDVKNGTFREDLFFRLYGLIIDLPPLRDRGKDVLILAKYFMDAFCKENQLPKKTLSDDAQQKLMAYSFPGNVRELKSVIELAIVLSNSNIITSDHINLSSSDIIAETLSEEMTLREYDLKIIKKYLQKYDGNMKLVAQKLDIGLSTIYRILKENSDK